MKASRPSVHLLPSPLVPPNQAAFSNNPSVRLSSLGLTWDQNGVCSTSTAENTMASWNGVMSPFSFGTTQQAFDRIESNIGHNYEWLNMAICTSFLPKAGGTQPQMGRLILQPSHVVVNLLCRAQASWPAAVQWLVVVAGRHIPTNWQGLSSQALLWLASQAWNCWFFFADHERTNSAKAFEAVSVSSCESVG